MTTLNRFGRIPIADSRGFPTPAFQVWLDGLLDRTGGAEQSLLAVDGFANVAVTLHSTDLPVVAVSGGQASDFDTVSIPSGHNTTLETV